MKVPRVEREVLERKYLQEGKSFVEVGKDLGMSKTGVEYWIHKYGIPTRPRSQNLINMVGEVHGKLTVLEKVLNPDNTAAKWLCQCECGKQVEVVRSSLVVGLTTSCGCVKFSSMWKGHGMLSGVYWNRIVKGAVGRDLPIHISIVDAWNLFVQQDGRCAISGVKINMETDYTRNHALHTASLDRINNSKGYALDNIQWVHKVINIMKRTMDQDEFIEWCKKVAEHNA